mgnify:CR=1 FL=1
MSKEINICLKPEGEMFTFPEGITLEEVKDKLKSSSPYIITSALVNNEEKDLVYKLYEDCTVQFLDLSNSEGLRVYVNSLSFLLLIASRRVFPGEPLHILHSLDRGLFCVMKNIYPIKKQKLKELEEAMKEIVEEDLPFKGKIMGVEDAVKLFKTQGSVDKVNLLEYYKDKRVPVYRCDGISDTFYGHLVPSTGYLKQFELTYCPPGFILRYPDIFSPDKLPEYANQRKLARIFYEYQKWVSLLGVDTLSSLNDFIRKGEISEIIRISEALQEKKIARMADMITQYRDQLKIILIAGPSASGKTTFSKRLATQLRVNGLKPIPISVDDYFIDVDRIPFDENGERNFEAIEVVDLELLNDHLISLLYGEEIELPSFDFAAGKSIKSGRKIKISDEHLLIMEGIHCLNDRLTEAVPQSNKYKIYVSALCQLNLDDHNRVSTTDTRKLRRIVRDHRFRGRAPQGTLNMWRSVRKGEEKYIYPFQEDADIMFNTALIYELSVIKTYAEPILMKITKEDPFYTESQRLLKFLDLFLPVKPDDVPPNSILREFIG